MTAKAADAYLIRVADLGAGRSVKFDLTPDEARIKALCSELDLLALRKVVFKGALAPLGKQDWALTGHLGATVVQPCSVTLEPVTNRVETEVERVYAADYVEPEGDEAEMPEDDSVEALGELIDLGKAIREALSLAMPLYPRAEGAELGEAVYTAPGVAPLTDEAAKPFAGLAALKAQMEGDE